MGKHHMTKQEKEEERKKMKRFKHNMPSWNSASIWFVLTNFLVVSVASTALWYAEGQLVNGTIFYNGLMIPFQEFVQRLFSVYCYVLLFCGVIGVIIGAVTSELNKNRQRTVAAREKMDDVFDVCSAVYVIVMVICLLGAIITGGVSTYLYVTRLIMPDDCPGQFALDAAPSSHCQFDNTLYLFVFGAQASNQFSLIWNFTQQELGCCGYWCSSNISDVRIVVTRCVCCLHGGSFVD